MDLPCNMYETVTEVIGEKQSPKTVDTVAKKHTRFAIYTVKPQYEQVSLNFCRGWWGLKNHHNFGIDGH